MNSALGAKAAIERLLYDADARVVETTKANSELRTETIGFRIAEAMLRTLGVHTTERLTEDPGLVIPVRSSRVTAK
jgi:GTP cyclohydrolase II